MDCPKCGRVVTHDKMSNTFYCEPCSYIFGYDDFLPQKSDKKKVKTNRSKGTEHVGIIGDIMLQMFALIPILGLGIAYIIGQADVSEERKQIYGARAIARIFAATMLIVVYACFIMNKQSVMLDKVHSGINTVSSILVERPKNIEVPKLESKDMKDFLSDVELPEQEEIVTELPVDKLRYINGSVVKGTTVSDIIDMCNNRYVGVLLNTNSITKKYNNKTYVNVMYLVNDSEQASSTSAYLYEGSMNNITELITDDYGEYVKIDRDVIDVSKYIYYLNPKSYYAVDIITNEELVLAILFTEVSYERK